MSQYDPVSKVWKGQGQQPQLNENDNFGKVLLDVLEQNHDKMIQICDDSGAAIMGYEMRTLSVRVAQNLTRMGIGKGDIIAVVDRNSRHLAPVVIGSTAIGAVLNTLSAASDVGDFQHMFALTRPKMIITEAGNLPGIRSAVSGAGLDVPIVVFGDAVDGTIPVQNLLQSTGAEESFVAPDLGIASETPAAILCSSGTTGAPKGVYVTHGQLLVMLGSIWNTNTTDVVLTFSSIYWISGYGIMMNALLIGATRITTGEPFSAALCLRLIEKYRVTKIFMPPSQISFLLEDPSIDKTDFDSVQILLTGGSMVSERLRESMQKRLRNGNVVVAYGMTECCGPIFSNYASVPGSVGSPNLNIEVKIIAEDSDGRHADVNEDGEIYFKAHPLFMGYFGNAKATKEIRDGKWLRTGDIGHFNENGYLFIAERKKEILKYCNYQVSPSEIEALIGKLEGILMVSVVGVPDETACDLPAAVIVRTGSSRITTDDVHKIVDSNLADYKKLRGGVHFIDQLPLTPSGKIKRKQVQEIAIRLFHSNQK